MGTSQEDSKPKLRACYNGAFLLAIVSAAVFLLLTLMAYPRHGALGVTAAAIASGLCLASSVAALFVTGMTTGTSQAMNGTFLGILLRTMVPFFVSIFLVQASKPLADTGLFGMVLISYFVVLAVETVLAIRIVKSYSPTVVRQ